MALDKQVFWEGSKGAEFFEAMKPREGDVVISRRRMFNSFFGTDLDQQLKAHGIEYVVLAGLTSHTCVEGTGRHAIEAGYHLTFLTDAVADFTEADHQVAVDVSFPKFAHAALTVGQFLDAPGVRQDALRRPSNGRGVLNGSVSTRAGKHRL